MPNLSTTPQLIERAAQQFNSTPFLVEDGEEISFQAFANRAKQVAAALMQAGIEKEDRVAIWAPNVSECRRQ